MRRKIGNKVFTSVDSERHRYSSGSPNRLHLFVVQVVTVTFRKMAAVRRCAVSAQETRKRLCKIMKIRKYRQKLRAVFSFPPIYGTVCQRCGFSLPPNLLRRHDRAWRTGHTEFSGPVSFFGTFNVRFFRSRRTGSLRFRLRLASLAQRRETERPQEQEPSAGKFGGGGSGKAGGFPFLFFPDGAARSPTPVFQICPHAAVAAFPPQTGRRKRAGTVTGRCAEKPFRQRGCGRGFLPPRWQKFAMAVAISCYRGGKLR